MFDPDPFNPVVYYAHLIIGSIGLLGALLALFARKGSALHKLGGRTFIFGATVAALSALIFVLTNFAAPPVVNAATALIGLATAVLALRQPTKSVRIAEYVFSAMLFVLILWFLSFALPALKAGRIGIVAPLTVLFVTGLFLIGDIRFFLQPAMRAARAVRRHMSRMLWTLALAVRAPLFELRDDWGIPTPLVLIGPLLLSGILILVFWRAAGQRTIRE